jgi:hypothetical protein
VELLVVATRRATFVGRSHDNTRKVGIFFTTFLLLRRCGERSVGLNLLGYGSGCVGKFLVVVITSSSSIGSFNRSTIDRLDGIQECDKTLKSTKEESNDTKDSFRTLH